MKNLHILVVDDEKTFREGMEILLISQGYTQVRTASTGPQALEMVSAEAPDVVLLDLVLPGMTGLQVLGELQRSHRQIPVLMLSCEADEKYQDTARLLGAYDYLVKPLVLASLLSYLELRLKEKTKASGG